MSIADLITSALPENVTIADIKTTKLTSSGDNYGSTLLAVDATITNHHHLYLVAKKVPQNQLVQEMFNCKRTFPNEVGFYQKIVPCLRQFQELKGTTVITSFPEFYAASREIETLLIKNIRKDGFDILDRTIGFDLVKSRLVLEKMAELHATVLALKVQEPQTFDEEVAPFFAEYKTFVLDDDSNDKMIKSVLEVVKDDEVCASRLSLLEEILQKSAVIFPQKNAKEALRNPFSTLVHSDLWTNNIMVKSADVKFVDYQLYEYTSLTRDVVFFIFSSIPVEVLTQHLDSLLHHYHHWFVSHLEELKCDSRIFSFESFIADMKHMVKKYEFFHIMTMLPPIYATSKDAKDVEQLEMENFIFNESEVTPAHREKACYIARELLKRGWLL